MVNIGTQNISLKTQRNRISIQMNQLKQKTCLHIIQLPRTHYMEMVLVRRVQENQNSYFVLAPGQRL